jgi:HK97 family phage portal protein
MSGLFGTLAAGLERKASALTELPSFMSWPEAKSGVSVNYQTALEATTVLACCRVLAEGIAQVPFQIMKRRAAGKGADVAFDHPLYEILHRRPNSWQTSFEFRETMLFHLVLCGNAYAFKNKVSGRIFELIPIEPGRVAVERRNDLSLVYRVTGEDGSSRVLSQDDIWHVRGPSWNSWMGMESVRLARESIGLSLALEQSHALLHKNGVQTSGVYSVEGALNVEQYGQLAKWIKAQTSGENRGLPLVLDRGAKWLQQQMTGVDAQHLETRKYQVEEICRAMRVFPQMVGYSDKTATFASAEAFFQAHATHSLQPWAERIEQSADVHLIGEGPFFALFDLRGLMRGAMKDQGEYYAKALGSGGAPAWMTQDEVRDEIDLNPMGGAAAALREPSNVGTPAPAKESV